MPGMQTRKEMPDTLRYTRCFTDLYVYCAVFCTVRTVLCRWMTSPGVQNVHGQPGQWRVLGVLEAGCGTYGEAFRGPWEAGQLAKLRQDDNDMAKIQSKCWPRQTLKVCRGVLLVETQETQEPQVQCLQIASNCLAQICLTSGYIKCCKKVSSSSTMQRFFSKMIGVLQKHHKSPQASQI